MNIIEKKRKRDNTTKLSMHVAHCQHFYLGYLNTAISKNQNKPEKKLNGPF